ncbi:uncharacterized protein LOC132174235 [Corylus avellana]|uniref:uncharacterized protein LOC132174235 n=1 Tax=Corylus avellana TaxID=13451 RepID=UPI00286ABE6C|nr:uncharacterized protein LOC132174235 [Corylus avellana]
MTPFEAVYGRLPPRLLTYVPGTTKMATVDEVLRCKEEILALLQHNLQHAQQRMKKYADLRRSKRTLAIRQQVYLRLQPYRQGSLVTRRTLKLSPRFYGPFTIVRKLKPKIRRSNIGVSILPPVDGNGIIQPKPVAVLARRSRPHKNHAITD